MFYGVLCESSYSEVNTKDIIFDGIKTKVKIKCDNKDSKLLSKVDSILKIVCSSSLYNYLYTLDKDLYEKDINQDPYFDGKTIKSGKDLMNAIKDQITHKNTAVFVDNYKNCIYFCGEYWIDEEHGYSIVFPEGKFIKGKAGAKKYDSNYKPVITFIGQYSDPL